MLTVRVFDCNIILSVLYWVRLLQVVRPGSYRMIYGSRCRKIDLICRA
jgi:hypothetical protein